MSLDQQQITKEIIDLQYQIEIRETVIRQHVKIQELNDELQKLKQIEKKYEELRSPKGV